MKRPPPRLGLDCEAVGGFWQEVTYEKIPKYCKHCRRMGHDIDACMFAHPELAKNPIPKVNPQANVPPNSNAYQGKKQTERAATQILPSLKVFTNQRERRAMLLLLLKKKTQRK